MYKLKWFFQTFTPVKVVIYQNIHSSNLASFLTNMPTHAETFAPVKQDKLDS